MKKMEENGLKIITAAAILGVVIFALQITYDVGFEDGYNVRPANRDVLWNEIYFSFEPLAKYFNQYENKDHCLPDGSMPDGSTCVFPSHPVKVERYIPIDRADYIDKDGYRYTCSKEGNACASDIRPGKGKDYPIKNN